jgi:WD40 repeat protein
MLKLLCNRTSMVRQSEDEFVNSFKEASDSWDLERLYKDLADAKQKYATSERRRYKDLTTIEKVYLRGLLCGNHPDSIAEVIHRNHNGVRVALCNGLYRYIEILVGKRPVDWRDVSDFLEHAKYKISLSIPALTNPTQMENGPTSLASSYRDWGEAPDVAVFFGRTDEFTILTQWILYDRCRLVAILGMRGVGKSGLSLKLGMGGIGKTDLSLKLAQGIQDEFDYVIWRSLLSAPKLMDLLADLIKFLSNQQEFDLPNTVEDRLSRLLYYLRSSRCLVLLDNAETLLRDGEMAGHYREGYEEYGLLLQKFGEVPHQSCLLITSREKPQEIALMEGKRKPVRSLLLSGLGKLDGKKIFTEVGEIYDLEFNASDHEWNDLIQFYDGNPLVLNITARHIAEVFYGNVSEFWRVGKPVFGNLCSLLDWHFERLSKSEKEIIYWLAINREQTSYSELQEDIAPSTSKEKIQDNLQSIQLRLPLERTITGFTLQPVLIEYTLQRLIDHICEEIITGKVELLNTHALLKASAKNYIRESQARLILKPIQEKLIYSLGSSKKLEARLRQMLLILKKASSDEFGYVAGNIINLFCHMKSDLSGFDFSHLTIWQAYLQGIVLHLVNFAHTKFVKCVFSETISAIQAVAFSPDGRIIATGDSDGDIRFWQISDSKQILTLKGHAGWIRSIDFGLNGQMLASGSEDRTVRLWNIVDGKCHKILDEHTDRVESVSFSPDGQLLASGSHDKTIRLWNIHSGECHRILPNYDSRVLAIKFSPDSQLLATSHDKTIRLWNIHDGTCFKTFEGHTSSVLCINFNSSGRILASGSRDGSIKLWDVYDGTCLKTLSEHTMAVFSVVFSPDSKILASGSEDKTIRLWNIESSQCFKTLTGHTSIVTSIDFSPNGKMIVSGSEDRTVRIWDCDGRCFKTLQGCTSWITSVNFSSSGQLLASSGEEQTVRIWNVKDGKLLNNLQGHTNQIFSVVFNSEGTNLATGSEDQTVRIWNVLDGHCKTLYGHANRVFSVSFSPDNQTLASGSEDQTIRIWDVCNGRCLKILKGHKGFVWSVNFNPHSKVLASGGNDQEIRLWDTDTGTCLKILEGHTHWIWSVNFSLDGRFLASGSEDQTIKIWDVTTGQCLKTLRGHIYAVRSVTFSPCGNILASGSDDNTVKLWDFDTGHCFKTLKDHNKCVRSLAFSPDGSMLASGSDDATIRFWDIKTGKCIRLLRAPRLCEEMNIISVTGLTEAQKSTLKALGAIEVPHTNAPLGA